MLLVFSCGDSAMLDLYGGDEVTIQSLADGSILAPGDTLPPDSLPCPKVPNCRKALI